MTSPGEHATHVDAPPRSSRGVRARSRRQTDILSTSRTYGSRATGSGAQASGFGLRGSTGHPATGYGLRATVLRLQASGFGFTGPPATGCRPQSVPATGHRPPATCYLLPSPAHRLLGLRTSRCRGRTRHDGYHERSRESYRGHVTALLRKCRPRAGQARPLRLAATGVETLLVGLVGSLPIDTLTSLATRAPDRYATHATPAHSPPARLSPPRSSRRR